MATSTPLLLLHGALGSRDQLKPLADVLKASRTVLRPNFHGHGKAGPSDAPFRLEAFADQVAQWLDDRGRRQVDIFGYSMGGYVGCYLAKNHPQLVGRIVTLGTKLDWNPEGAKREIKMLNPDVIAEKVPAFAALLQERHGQEHWRTLLKKTAEMMLHLGETGGMPEADFQTIEHPVKLMIGQEDNMVSTEETRQVAEWLPNATLELLPGVPHPIEKIDPSELSGRILEFTRA